MDLSGKIALVTGAGTGIGQGIALELAGRGATVAVHYNSSADGAKETLRQIEERGGKGMIVQGNVSRKEEIDAMVQKVADAWGGIDILVNNAALQLNIELLDYSEEDFDRVMNVNLKGYWQCMQAVVPYMKAKGSGRIIIISSVHGKRPSEFDVVYSMTKGGIKMLGREAAAEFGRHGITVNIIEPGAIAVARTMPQPKKTDDSQEPAKPKPPQRDIRWKFPMGRVGLPSDVAALAAYIASDESEFMSGASIRLDGSSMLL